MVTTSRAVPELFGKALGHPMRYIDGLLGSGHPNLDRPFREHAADQGKARKLVPGFDLTKEGFMLLAVSLPALLRPAS